MLRSTTADGTELIKGSKDAIFHAIVEALDCQTWSSQEHAATVLHTLFGMRHGEKTFVVKEFQSTILQGLPDILKLLVEDQPHRTVGGAAGLLALSEDGMLGSTISACTCSYFQRNRTDHRARARRFQACQKSLFLKKLESPVSSSIPTRR